MARRRRRRLSNALSGLGQGLGNVSSAMLQNSMLKKRQLEVSEQNRQGAILQSLLPRISSGELDPEQLSGLLPAEMTAQLTKMRPPIARRRMQASDDLLKFTNPDEAPTPAMARRRLEGGGVPTERAWAATETQPLAGGTTQTTQELESTGELEAILADIEARSGGLKTERDATRPRTPVTDITGVTRFLTSAEQGQTEGVKTALSPEEKVEQAGAESKAQALGQGQGQEQAAAESFSAVLARKQQEYESLTPATARRAAAESWARVPAEMELLRQRHTQEMAQAGNRAGAEDLSRRNSAVRGLMPMYQRYRDLAVQVASSAAGAGTPVAGSALTTIGRLPAIGEFLASGLETAHSGVTGLGSKELSTQIAELNRLTDALAQGMANAVLGNRGQTTENDRRTAKQMLASSFTDAKTLGDLLDITDRMFTIMPTLASQQLAQDPLATPAQILEAARARAKQESALSPAARRAVEVLNAR